MAVPGAHVEPAPRGGELPHGVESGGVRRALSGERLLGVLAAQSVVGIAVVIVPAGGGEHRILKYVAAGAALVEVKGARLELDEIGRIEPVVQPGRTAPGACPRPGPEQLVPRRRL